MGQIVPRLKVHLYVNFTRGTDTLQGRMDTLQGGTDGRTDGRKDGRMDGCLEITPSVLQDIGPLGPLPKKGKMVM